MKLAYADHDTAQPRDEHAEVAIKQQQMRLETTLAPVY